MTMKWSLPTLDDRFSQVSAIGGIGTDGKEKDAEPVISQFTQKAMVQSSKRMMRVAMKMLGMEMKIRMVSNLDKQWS